MRTGVTAIVPPAGNQFISLFKATSLVSVIAGGDLLTAAENISSTNLHTIELMLVATFWYLVLTVVWSFIQAWIEGRLAASERGDQLSFWERMREAWAPVPGRLWGRTAR